ncbi:MAG: DNA polymerase III subunit gamma/tau [Lactobacillaceae bacterium]|jgi:DNA polymerase-3 subunit gamma/tau|nr:DNA polymerase III subunit gamma/tau [Lactobacillaceae bacterium]
MNQKQDNQYVVLARKYRPQNFDDLVGQDALVQTLTNAIKNNRLHHAYILTGIRGVGKTTTARIIAKALNCIGLDGKGGPTPHPCGVCENCVAIANDRHIDVIELDAASRTGVDDVREILDGVRYKPVTARYKIYIIDEVHMLSKSAFNALLKTLEEPPAHVKFIFATTEIRKVPITILSRCQRFDLQRITIEDLTNLFKKIAQNEGIKADDEALHIIAKAADGSARDGESLLDQAISLGGGNIKLETVKEMIGLADRNQTFDLFESLLSGDIEKVVKNLNTQYKNGATPMLLLQDLVNITHLIAKTKIVPSFINDASLTESEKDLCKKLNGASIAVLSKIWQMLLKGISELQIAPVQIDALEMILIRVAYSAGLPTPNEILTDVKKNSNLTQPQIYSPTPVKRDIKPIENGSAVLASVEDLISYLEKNKKALMAYSLKNDLSIEEFRDGFMKIAVSERLQPDFIMSLHKIFEELTGKAWEIDIIRGALGETIADKENARKEEDKRNVSEVPLVRAILEEFKGAKIDIATRKILSGEIDNNNINDEPEFFSEEF